MSDATPAAPPAKTTVSITVDGRAHEARPGQRVIDACEDAGVYVPRFCYHRRMASVGMCRSASSRSRARAADARRRPA